MKYELIVQNKLKSALGQYSDFSFISLNILQSLGVCIKERSPNLSQGALETLGFVFVF